MNKRRWIVPLAVLVLALSACGGGDSEEAGGETDAGNGAAPLPVTVTASNFAFDPDAITAHATHTVDLTFVNEDDTAHTFTIDELDVDIEAAGGEEATATFTPEELGSLEFYCKFHPAMTGELTVE